MDSKIESLLEFMNQTVHYLHSWICTKDGEYKTYSLQDVRRAVMGLLLHQDNDIINRFKNNVNDGSIILFQNAFCIADNVKIELYKHHLDLMKQFEEKYHINNEENKK